MQVRVTKPPPDLEAIFARYQRLQRYVNWSDDDAGRVQALKPLVEPEFDAIIADFYARIQLEPEAAAVIQGGDQQVARLKVTLRQWLEELFSGTYDAAYVHRRWRVGWRHVDIGLAQVYTHVSLARVRERVIEAISGRWTGSVAELQTALRSVHRLLDLDLAVIADAYQAEHADRLRESERLAEKRRSDAAFRDLVEAAGALIVILRPDYRLAYFNPFAEHLTGRAAAEVLGRNYLELFVAAEERPPLADQIARNLAGQPTRDHEHSVLCSDGTFRRIMWNAQRLDDFDGQPAVLAIGQDITKRKEAEERALQAERLAAIGQTVAGLAHESRNAFQRSQSCLELLALELEGNPGQLELVDRIRRALDHLHRLYEEVRDYAAPVRLEKQACDLSHVWRDAWAHLEVLRKSQRVRFVDQPGNTDLVCNADWFALGQVFRNIFENALAACPEPGEIVVTCQTAELRGGSALRISIQDNGPGFLPEARARVFDPFFTTKPKGTGLGLAIAKRLVEAHGGEITVGSEPGGAQFVITLPRQ